MEIFRVALLALVWSCATQAQEKIMSLQAPHASKWENGFGSGFKENAIEAGLSLGGAFGMKILGSSERHDLVLGAAHIGWVFSDMVAKDRWYRGNWEIIGQLFGGKQVHPESAYVTGVTPLLRYNFVTGTRLTPFADAGVGATLTDIGEPDLSTTLQFNIQFGAGVHYFVGEHMAVTFQYRAMHFSNARIATPNLGVNSNALLAGVSWWF